MRKTTCLFLGLLVLLTTTASAALPPARRSRSQLADYDAELRRPDGRVDTDAMVQRLKELGVTTYYWLVWHAGTDWDDLKLFLPKAARANIDVWVYLVPPSESPPYAAVYSEPYRLDYVRWGEAIARLSLEHSNLTAWVIDDFCGNLNLFTPAYVANMQAKAKAVNPRLAFLPLLYFNDIRSQFIPHYRSVIDGAVVAYLKDRGEIDEIWAVLNDAGTLAAASSPAPPKARRRAFRIPFISMVAADPQEFKQRHGAPASPERIGRQLELSLDAWRAGKCDGVVTYCLDKRPGSAVFTVVRRLYWQFARTKRGTTRG